MKATAGDWLIVRAPHTGKSDRRGVIVEVRGAAGGPPYLVRWDDTDHEGLVFPGADARVEHPRTLADGPRPSDRAGDPT